MSRSIYRILTAVLLVAFFASAVPLVVLPRPGWVTCHRWLSVLLSLVVLCVCSVSLTYINRKFFSVSSTIESMPLLYLLLVSVEPSSLCFSEFHIAALLLIWAVYQTLRYISYERPKPCYYFYAVLMLSCSCLLVPSLVWLLPVSMSTVLLICPDRSVKVFLMTVGGAALPVIYLLSFMFFANMADISGFWTEWWYRASASGISFADASLVRLFYMASLTIVVSVASFSVFGVYDTAIGSRKKILCFTLISTLTLFAIRLFFGIGWVNSPAPVMMVPISLILLNYLVRPHGRTSFTLMAVLLITAAVYRISAFL